MYASHQFSCNHEEEIQKLSRNLDAVTADNAALVVENQELKERVENLTHELSVKEATWCETEEQLNLKVIDHFQIPYIYAYVIMSTKVFIEYAVELVWRSGCVIYCHAAAWDSIPDENGVKTQLHVLCK